MNRRTMAVVCAFALSAGFVERTNASSVPFSANPHTVWIAPLTDDSVSTAEPMLSDDAAAVKPPIILPVPPEGWTGLSMIASMIAIRGSRRVRVR